MRSGNMTLKSSVLRPSDSSAPTAAGQSGAYPSGLDGHAQSKLLRAVAALSWELGLSHRSVGHLLTALGCELARMSSCEMDWKRESAR